MSKVPPVLVWFRNDLRLSDHPALAAAAASGAPLVCVYVHDEQSAGIRPLGGASRWWLAGSLRALDQALHKHGQRIVLRRGAAAEIVPALAKEIGASAVYWNRRYARGEVDADAAVAAALTRAGVAVHGHPGSLLQEPEAVRTAAGTPPRVFAAFWKRLRAVGDPRDPLSVPKRLGSPTDAESDKLTEWDLEPTKPDWAGGLREAWTPGETGAQAQLKAFVKDGLAQYAIARDRVDPIASSRLSPHLRFGEISPAQVWYAVRAAKRSGTNSEKFLAELGWRDFAYSVLIGAPDLATRNLRDQFGDFPWRSAPAALKGWQRGQTGYPIVDAAMRQLWHTGWMPNRMRMVTGSFLVKHLLIDWRKGEQWFWDTLVDADPANNPTNWQWVAGSGIDATPFFRIFNPVLQAQKADPTGAYVREWVPEIAKLPDTSIHTPWELTPVELESCGVTLGKTYPHPIVDHAKARQRALEALTKIRNRSVD